jgi:hypothetical protein
MWHDPKKKNIPHVQSCPKQGLWDPHVACTRLPSKSCKDSLSYASTRAITSISFVVYIIIYSPHARACMSPKGKKKSRDEIVGLDRTVRSAFRCSASQYYCGNWEVTIGMRLWAKWKLCASLTAREAQRVFCCTLHLYTKEDNYIIISINKWKIFYPRKINKYK